MSAFDTIKTYTIKNNTSTASLAVTRRADGSYSFTGASGNVRIVNSTGASEEGPLRDLLEAIDALV